MNKDKIRGLLISDFNVDIFSSYLNNDDSIPALEVISAPYGQVSQILLNKDSDLFRQKPDFIVIWTRPEGIISSFHQVLLNKFPSIKTILDEVDSFGSLIKNISGLTGAIFIPSWTLSPTYRGLGMLDMKKDMGVSNILMQMNLRLSEIFETINNVHLLNAQNWLYAAGKNAVNPKLWYRGKVAFGNEVYKQAVKDIKAAIMGIKGNARKIIILDLDDTLWGGIVGDAGWENLVLGGHDPIGEGFKDFQLALKAMQNRGIILGIVSKNNESVALEAINKHPEMVLRTDDFAGWRINWNDKASNIVDLISDLNLGLQSAVFIDDNPRERSRVRDALPEVFVPEWPDDPMMYTSTLYSLRCFDVPSVSKEDIKRTKMYVSEKKRKELKSSVRSIDDWLASLETKVMVENLSSSNIQRTAQLFNKTNQMNLTTRRMSESELLKWAEHDDHSFWVFRVSDKFGDSGLTGIISLEREDKIGKIADFILSCRVMGRKIEETMIYIVINHARQLGIEKLIAKYIQTPKNSPCLEFWKRSGFDFDEQTNSFTWYLNKQYDKPKFIEIIMNTTN
jgi:FkbH-like protein